MKGDVPSVLLHVIMSVIILALAFGVSESLEPKIKVETTNVVASRISSAAYMMNGVDEGETELDLDGEYGFTYEENGYYVNYTAESLVLEVVGGTGKAQVNPPTDFTGETGYAENICLGKDENSVTSIEMGSCQ